MQALDLAACLRVIWPGVLEDDVKALELVLEQHLAVAVAAHEHSPVVGEQRLRQAVQLGCLLEALHDVGRFDARVCIAAQMKARVIVDQIEDLDHLARCQTPARDVRLPAFIRQLRFEADQRRARALLALGLNESLTPQNAPDGREGGNVLWVWER